MKETATETTESYRNKHSTIRKQPVSSTTPETPTASWSGVPLMGTLTLPSLLPKEIWPHGCCCWFFFLSFSFCHQRLPCYLLSNIWPQPHFLSSLGLGYDLTFPHPPIPGLVQLSSSFASYHHYLKDPSATEKKKHLLCSMKYYIQTWALWQVTVLVCSIMYLFLLFPKQQQNSSDHRQTSSPRPSLEKLLFLLSNHLQCTFFIHSFFFPVCFLLPMALFPL